MGDGNTMGRGSVQRVVSEYRTMLPRAFVRGFICPSCGAGIGNLCIGARGKPRVSNHLERVELAESTL